MEFTEVVRRRRMVRSFDGRAVDPALLQRLLEDSLRAPSAGNTSSCRWLVLEGPDTATYWDHATTGAWRARSARWPGLSRAPVAALSLVSAATYVDRYAEDDKAASGLGSQEASWPVPYWIGDGAFAVMTLLLGAADAGLGACFLGTFRGEAALLAALGVPDGWRLFGTVLLGHPDGGDHRSPSLDRPVRRPDRVHHRRWPDV